MILCQFFAVIELLSTFVKKGSYSRKKGIADEPAYDEYVEQNEW